MKSACFTQSAIVFSFFILNPLQLLITATSTCAERMVFHNIDDGAASAPENPSNPSSPNAAHHLMMGPELLHALLAGSEFEGQLLQAHVSCSTSADGASEHVMCDSFIDMQYDRQAVATRNESLVIQRVTPAVLPVLITGPQIPNMQRPTRPSSQRASYLSPFVTAVRRLVAKAARRLATARQQTRMALGVLRSVGAEVEEDSSYTIVQVDCDKPLTLGVHTFVVTSATSGEIIPIADCALNGCSAVLRLKMPQISDILRVIGLTKTAPIGEKQLEGSSVSNLVHLLAADPDVAAEVREATSGDSEEEIGHIFQILNSMCHCLLLLLQSSNQGLYGGCCIPAGSITDACSSTLIDLISRTVFVSAALLANAMQDSGIVFLSGTGSVVDHLPVATAAMATAAADDTAHGPRPQRERCDQIAQAHR